MESIVRDGKGRGNPNGIFRITMRQEQLDEYFDRMQHESRATWAMLRKLRPCICGFNEVDIEPCQIRCDGCGRMADGLNWVDACADWNEHCSCDGESPELDGWI